MSITLAKGQTINLAKSTGAGLTQVRMGLGWDVKVTERKTLFGGTKRVQKAIDLDASALLIGGGKVGEIVYFGQLRSKDGSIVHTGDNLTGAGDGDDESIMVDLTRIAPWVEHVVFTVNSYSGETFTDIDNASVRVVDSTDGDRQLGRFTLTGSGAHTALVMARVSRAASGWTFTAIGRPGQGRTANQLGPLALQCL
ncbi:TerD family protein [Isoptericola sp. NPDC057191]|uniref:TerD family protein n=1 Tax=Isoptericola sp. NPDC057191 TaxID=3346041 RepID=UPI00362F0513